MADQEATGIHYHAGHNMPGYLPESDVACFETFEDAKRYQIDEMDRTGDFLFDSGSDDDKTEADELSGAMEDLNLDSGPEWGVVVGNTSWWIVTVPADDCEGDDL